MLWGGNDVNSSQLEEGAILRFNVLFAASDLQNDEALLFTALEVLDGVAADVLLFTELEVLDGVKN